MGFFSKFANTVLPAAATALPFVLSGGTINPLTSGFGLAGAGALASAVGAGAKGLAGAEAKDREKKGRKRQRRDMNQANLVSALTRGKVNPLIADRTPSAGFIEKAAGGVSQGAGIGGAVLTATDVIKRREALDKIKQDAIDKGVDPLVVHGITSAGPGNQNSDRLILLQLQQALGMLK